jgi:DNA invertase Pin-like site-specific DNA recombinase
MEMKMIYGYAKVSALDQNLDGQIAALSAAGCDKVFFEKESGTKERGVKFGRKLKLTAHQRQEALARREAGETTVAIARSFEVSHSMISRL